MSQLLLMGVMVFAAFLGAVGQIFLKNASGQQTLITNWYLYGFVATYGIAVIIQTLVYRAGGKVSIIYPVIALSYVFASFLAWKFLGESISGWTIGGTAIIIIGVGMIGYGA